MNIAVKPCDVKPPLEFDLSRFIPEGYEVVGDTQFVKAALWLADRWGFRIFRLLVGGKTPAIDHWKEAATYDLEEIWTMWVEVDPVLQVVRVRSYNIAIATGRTRSGFVMVMDVDIKDGAVGLESLAKLDLLAPEPWLEGVMTTESRSGGPHYFFSTPTPLANTASSEHLGRNLDTRGEGGYVVAAGSTVGGKPYTYLGGEPKPAPDWLVERVGAAPLPSERVAEPMCELDTPGNLARATAYLKHEAPIAVEGQGGDATTLQIIMRVGDEGVSEGECFDLIMEHHNDRNDPPWAPDEMERKIANGYLYRAQPLGCRSPERHDPDKDFDECVAPTELPVGANDNGDPVLPSAGRPSPDRFKMEKFCQIRPNFTRRDLIKGLMMSVSTVALIGAPNAGKSQLGAHICFAIASGTPWCGRKVQQGTVIAAIGEGAEGYRGRVEALRQIHGDVDIPFYMVPAVPNLLDTKDVHAFVAACRATTEVSGHPLRLIQIDTMTTAAYGGDTNTVEVMSRIVAACRHISSELQCVVMPIHHLGKDASKGARGSNVFVADLDTELTIEAAENNRIVVRTTKQRDFEKGPDLIFKQQSAVIGQDADGVEVTAVYATWLERPEADPDDDFDPPTVDLRALLGTKPWRAHVLAGEKWVGFPIANALKLDPRRDRKAIKQRIADYVEDGLLLECDVTDGEGHARPCYRVPEEPTDTTDSPTVG